MMFLMDIYQLYIVPENAVFVDHGFKHSLPVSLVLRMSLPSVRTLLCRHRPRLLSGLSPGP